MPELRASIVTDPVAGEVRAYPAPEVARLMGVTPKTVVAWVGRSVRGWKPRTEPNPGRSWLVDADEIDRRLSVSRPATDPTSVREREQLTLERQMLEMERSMFHQTRLEQLETDNARLRADNERLRAQVAALGLVVQQLTTESV